MFSLIPSLYAMSPQKGQAESGMMGQLMLFGSIFLIFYLLVIRPQQKKAKAHTKLLEELKAGDDVITATGLYGKIKKKHADKDFVEIEIAPNTVVKIETKQIAGLNPLN